MCIFKLPRQAHKFRKLLYPEIVQVLPAESQPIESILGSDKQRRSPLEGTQKTVLGLPPRNGYFDRHQMRRSVFQQFILVFSVI